MVKNPHKKNIHRKSVIIVNPVSGLGETSDRVDSIRKIAHFHGWEGDIIETKLSHSAHAIAKEHLQKGVTHFIVCGGDGTVMEVIGAVVGKDALLGIVPAGTGNLLAQNLNIPTDTEKAFKIALLGKPIKIDIGKANEIYFGIMAGMGLDAEMIKKTSRDMKDKLGVIAYGLSAFQNMFKPLKLYEVTVNDLKTTIYNAKSIMVANMSKITGGVEIVPGADPQNGTLRVGIIQAKEWYSWLSILFNTLRGNINKSPHFTLLKANTIDITCIGKPQVYQCDGNDFPAVKNLKVTIYPSSLSVMTP